ncbi:MAG: hypothetical protein ABSA39_22470 [Edaphobacter sp.]|jgi:hypothetical protein
MVRLLTKVTPDGVLYTRPAAIEIAIRVAIQQDIECLRRRAELSDESEKDFLPLECLVYLIREAWRRGDHPSMNTLMEPLLARCERLLRATMLESAEEHIENILSNFSFVFIEDGNSGHTDELDYFECRFFRAFRFFRIDYLRRERSRAEHFEPLQEQYDSDDGSDDRQVRLPSEIYGMGPTQMTDVFRNERIIAISKLPPDECKAVFLCGILGLKEESEDPDAMTAAKLCRVTGRTIRNRLTRAAAKLSQYRKEV